MLDAIPKVDSTRHREARPPGSSLLNTGGRQPPKPYHEAGRTKCSLCPVHTWVTEPSKKGSVTPLWCFRPTSQGTDRLFSCSLVPGYDEGIKDRALGVATPRVPEKP